MKQDDKHGLLPLTPGPWRHEPTGPGWRIYGSENANGSAVPIAEVVQPSEANATLIAAAPKMLDLLVRWSRAGESSAPELQRAARELISELECGPTPWESLYLSPSQAASRDARALARQRRESHVRRPGT